MAEFTQAQLDELVAAAIERLDQRARDAERTTAPDDLEPHRTTYDVRSEQTGAAVIIDVPEPVAQAEAERLNAEARRPIGEVLVDRRRLLHAGEQGGSGPTTYVVVEREALDERARAGQLEQLADETRSQVASAEDDAQREALARTVEQLDEQAAELTAEADALEGAHRDALEGQVVAGA